MRISKKFLYPFVPPNKPIPFQQILPLKLKDQVSGKSESEINNACIQEMSVLMTCLKENEFNQSFCSEEIKNFQKCNKEQMLLKKEVLEKSQGGFIEIKNRRSNFKYINKILKNFPSPRT